MKTSKTTFYNDQPRYNINYEREMFELLFEQLFVSIYKLYKQAKTKQPKMIKS